MKINIFLRSKVAKFISIFTLMAVAVASVGFAAPALADSSENIAMLQVSPSRVTLQTQKPGETYEGSFYVQNTGNVAYSYSVEVAPFTVSGTQYDPIFDKSNNYTEITDWITLDSEEGTVAPQERQTVKYTISIPKDAPAGAQSAAIIVTMINDSSNTTGTGIQPVSRVAYVIYTNVAGSTRQTGEILENKVPSIVFDPPVVATSTVKNTGNVYTEAEYWLEVRNFFGDNLVYSNTHYEDGVEIPIKYIIMPESERYNEVAWENAPQLGIFKVKQTVKIFDEVSTVEKVVFLCPIWFLVIVIAFVAILVFMILSHILKKKDR